MHFSSNLLTVLNNSRGVVTIYIFIKCWVWKTPVAHVPIIFCCHYYNYGSFVFWFNLNLFLNSSNCFFDFRILIGVCSNCLHTRIRNYLPQITVLFLWVLWKHIICCFYVYQEYIFTLRIYIINWSKYKTALNVYLSMYQVIFLLPLLCLSRIRLYPNNLYH